MNSFHSFEDEVKYSLRKEDFDITNLIVAVFRQTLFRNLQKETMDYSNASNHIMIVRKPARYEQIANHYLSLTDLWILLATALVSTMHFGSATLESDLQKLKILTKPKSCTLD